MQPSTPLGIKRERTHFERTFSLDRGPWSSAFKMTVAQIPVRVLLRLIFPHRQARQSFKPFRPLPGQFVQMRLPQDNMGQRKTGKWYRN